MNRIFRIAAKGTLGVLLATTPLVFTACDEDEDIVYDISVDESQLTKTVAWE